MTRFDASQSQVQRLDPARHARVLGAPGSGKTELLLDAFTRFSNEPGWVEGDVLVMASGRLVAADLRRRIEQRLDRARGATPVHTAPALAFSVLNRVAAVDGRPAPRLLTGTAHDEVVEAVIRDALEGRAQSTATTLYAPEVLQSEAYRGELREMSRVFDDFEVQRSGLLAELAARGGEPGAPTAEMLEQWGAASELLEMVRARLDRERPGELTASAMTRLACRAIRERDEVRLPRLVLVDDAAELGEGAVALLAALANRGTRVWVFGDPDIATGAFHGERSSALAGLADELRRRSSGVRGAVRPWAAGASAEAGDEQVVVLQRVYRHGAEIRELVCSLSERIGTAGAGQQRGADAVPPGAEGARDGAEPGEAHDPEQPGIDEGQVRFVIASQPAEQLGIIAHRLRSTRLGLGASAATPWSKMAVICRSRSEVKHVARVLAGHQVPSSVAAGGWVLREHQLVRELIRLLQHAIGIAPIGAREVSELLSGTIGGLDPIALRRLRGALRVQAVRMAAGQEADAAAADELLLEAFANPGDRPVLDMRAARRLRRLGLLADAASSVHASGGTPREVLWQLWDGSGLAEQLQRQALESRGQRSDDAHRMLDAVVGLFFALQRHEEQDSDRPIEALLEDLLTSSVAEDSLAARSEREVVTVTTPQGAVGREFDVVCVVGVQDGAWPNLRARGSLLSVTALERWLRGYEAQQPSRRDTMHDELRLLTHAVSRARREVLVVSVRSEQQQPGPFFSLGGRFRTDEKLPSSRLTLRGAVAEMRRRLVDDQRDAEALEALVALAGAGAAGAHPDEWYGVRPITTEAPLADIEHDPEAVVSVSPSQMERAETCPLDWIVSKLGGGQSDYRANIGTLLHHALEVAPPGATTEELFELVEAQWGALRFEATWQSERALVETQQMAGALASYLGRFERSDQTLLANEARFEVPINFARVRGAADRIEAEPLDDGGFRVTVVDLKTGRRTPTANEVEEHAQLQAYQLGVLRGAFVDSEGRPIASSGSGGAKLVYVHPDTLNKTRRASGEKYVEIVQPSLDEAKTQAFEQRVREVASIMAGSRFAAQIDHHCLGAFGGSTACSIHIVRAVSHA